MPRLTNHQYLYRHASLKTVMRTWPDLLRLLSVKQQQALHAYYRPSEQQSERDLLAHRHQLDAHQPSVAQNAGRAFGILHRAFQEICETYPDEAILNGRAVQHYVAARANPPASVVKAGERCISISPVILPAPNLELLAKILIRLAQDRPSPEDAAQPPDEAAAA